jgi:putative addiction module component (TIGR02574 family)
VLHEWLCWLFDHLIIGPTDMSANQIAIEALRLSEKERADLASRLLRSLPPVALAGDDGLAEALRRDEELDTDPAQAISLQNMDSHVRERHQS